MIQYGSLFWSSIVVSPRDLIWVNTPCTSMEGAGGQKTSGRRVPCLWIRMEEEEGMERERERRREGGGRDGGRDREG